MACLYFCFRPPIYELYGILLFMDLLQIFVIGIAALMGLGIGSFFNVVIFRLPESESIQGRSRCPHCKHQLSWYELIPVASYVFLAGKCRHCEVSISLQYPVVELIMATLFVIIAQWFWPNPIQIVIYTIYTALLILIFIYDLKYYLIPDAFTLPGIVLAIIGAFILGISPLNLAIGMTVGGGLFSLQYLISKGRWIGGGDIRLGFLLGAMLGWPNVLVSLFTAYLVGAAVAIGLMIRGRKTMKDMLPFGTFLSIATIFSFLWGDAIIHWYFYDILNL